MNYKDYNDYEILSYVAEANGEAIDVMFDKYKPLIQTTANRMYCYCKNTDIITYKYATGLEALIGYLYLEKRKERIEELMNYIRGE